MILLVAESTIVLLLFKVFRYSCTVGDSWSSESSAILLRIAWGKDMNVSIPIRDTQGSTVKGTPFTSLRWISFLSAISVSIIVESSMVLKYNVLDVLMSFHLTDVSNEMYIVLRLDIS